MRTILIVLFTCMVFTAFSQKMTPEEIDHFGIDYIDYTSMDSVYQLAKEQNKLVFVNCYNNRQPACVRNDDESITPESLGKFYDDHFINVLYNIEENRGTQFSNRYKVMFGSVLLYLNPKQELVHKVRPGCSGRTNFMEGGKMAINPDSCLMGVNRRMNNGEMDSYILETYLSLNMIPNKERVKYFDRYMDSISEDEKTNEASWNLIKRFPMGLDSKYFQFVLDNEEILKEKHTTKEVNEFLKSRIKFHIQLHSRHNYSTKYVDPLEHIQTLNHPVINKAIVLGHMKQAESDCTKNKGRKGFWMNYLELGNELYELENAGQMELNDAGWFVFKNYKHFDDEKALKTALKWIERSVEINRNCYNVDSYACILNRMGKSRKAAKLEAEAIELAEAAGKDDLVGVYQKRLDKFRN